MYPLPLLPALPRRSSPRAPLAKWARLRPALTTSCLLLLLLSGDIGCMGRTDARLAEARALQAAGEFERAIVTLQSILAERADHAEANFLLGEALLQTGRSDLAVEPLRQAAKGQLYAVPAGLMLASTLLQTAAYSESIRAATTVLEIDPENATALLTRGQALIASGKPAEALADSERVLELRPGTHNALVLKGGSLIDLGQRDEAEKVWLDLRTRTAAQGTPNQAARACAQLALFYRTQQENDDADRTYAECLEAYPDHRYLQRWASDFYLRQNRPARAIEIHRDAIGAAPRDIHLRGELANLLFTYGETRDAQHALEETVASFDTPEAWRLLADFHRKTGDATQARKALEEAIERSSEPREAFLFSLADLLVEEGDLERAREIRERLTEPSYRSLIDGAISLRSGDPKRALEHFDVGLALWPDNPGAHYLAGQAAFQLHDSQRAITEFHAAIRVGVTATDAAGRLAEIYFARGDYTAAQRFAHLQLMRRPFVGDPSAFQLAIRSALELGQFDQARRMVESLRRTDPKDPWADLEQVEIARREGGAELASRTLIGLDRDLREASAEPLLRVLAEDLRVLGRESEALVRIDHAIARNPESAPLYDLKARVLSSMHRVEDAAIAIQRALQIDPDFAPALALEGLFAYERGDRARALESLDAATAADPDNADYPYQAATLCQELGDRAAAIARLENALMRRPGYGPAANDLAWLLAEQKQDLDRAHALASIAALRLRTPNALDTLGFVQHQRGELDEAITTYRAALAQDADQPAIRYRLGRALAAAGHAEEARILLDELVQGPEFPELEAARAELARIRGS